jgi:hypothetical protein
MCALSSYYLIGELLVALNLPASCAIGRDVLPVMLQLIDSMQLTAGSIEQRYFVVCTEFL